MFPMYALRTWLQFVCCREEKDLLVCWRKEILLHALLELERLIGLHLWTSVASMNVVFCIYVALSTEELQVKQLHWIE